MICAKGKMLKTSNVKYFTKYVPAASPSHFHFPAVPPSSVCHALACFPVSA